jgi:G:T-mismatch repair DNA endonuclease (very short patch repair protein)
MARFRKIKQEKRFCGDGCGAEVSGKYWNGTKKEWVERKFLPGHYVKTKEFKEQHSKEIMGNKFRAIPCPHGLIGKKSCRKCENNARTERQRLEGERECKCKCGGKFPRSFYKIKGMIIEKEYIVGHGMKGKLSNKKNKTNNELYGEEKARLINKKISKAIKKQINEGKIKVPTFKGRHHSEQTKKQQKELRLTQTFPVQDTKIEKKLQQQLTEAGIIFKTHHPILGQPDIFIEPLEHHKTLYKGITIFADGCAYHACPIHLKRAFKSVTDEQKKAMDLRVTNRLFDDRYYVLRISEHDINHPNFNIIPIIKELIGE